MGPKSGADSVFSSGHNYGTQFEIHPERIVYICYSYSGGWISALFKASRIPATVVKAANLVASGTALSIAIYTAIQGCKDTPGAEEYLEKFEKVKNETMFLNKKAESYQLEGKKSQD